MDNLIENIQKLPEVIENKIWRYVHSYNLYKINQKIKYEVNMFGDYCLDGGSIHEFWFNIGLKQLPKSSWYKISPHHKRYNDLKKWHEFEYK